MSETNMLSIEFKFEEETTPTTNPTPGKTWSELIRCPECKADEWAMVEQGHEMPFPFYKHDCQNCGHVILESEWDKVGESKGERKPGRTRLVYDKTKRAIVVEGQPESYMSVALRAGGE